MWNTGVIQLRGVNRCEFRRRQQHGKPIGTDSVENGEI